MIRAGLTPLADTQRTCVEWLRNYVETYGDSDPARSEKHLIIMHKKDVYRSYCNDMDDQQAALDYPRPKVSESRFFEIWNVLFPFCVNRPWCDIPGKCKICAEIDNLRRTKQGNLEQQKLKEAHHLHRCGMFMQERNK